MRMLMMMMGIQINPQLVHQENLLLKKRVEKLESQLREYKYDSLTGCLGKIDFDEEFSQKFNGSCRLYLVDINGLHNTNREGGWEAGNAMIKQVAQNLQSCFIEPVYRIGGDEFCILTEEDVDEKLHHIDEKLHHIDNIIWASESSNGWGSKNEMFKAADKKLISKKHQYYHENRHLIRKCGTCNTTHK